MRRWANPFPFRASVGAKFAAATALFTAVVLVAGALLVVHQIESSAAQQAEVASRAMSGKVSGAVQTIFDDALRVIDKTSEDFAALQQKGVVDPQVYDTLLRGMMEAGSDRFGAWFVWSPTAFAAGENVSHTAYWHQNGMDTIEEAVPSSIMGSDLYHIPAATGASVLLEPHAIDAAAGDPTLVTSFARAIGNPGTPIGVIAIDLKLDAIANALALIDLPKGSSLFVVSQGGIVATSTNPAWVGRPLRSLTSDPWLLEGQESDRNTVVAAADGRRFLKTGSAIHFSGSPRSWHLFLETPIASGLATAGADQLFLLGTATIAILLIVAFVVFAMEHIVSKPLRGLSRIVRELSEGVFAIDVPNAKRSDEVGDIARAVQALQDSGLEIARLHEANGEAEYQRHRQRQEEHEVISARFSQKIKALVEILRDVAKTVGTQAEDVSGATEAAFTKLTAVADASRFATQSFASVTEATSSFLSTISSIGQQTSLGRTASSCADRSLTTTEASISDLRSAIMRIQDGAQLVSDIAGQINLIALNATIEAARAGEAGLGFAIVAQEVKTLSKRTEAATTEITKQLVAVRRAFEGTGARVAEMKDAFVEVRVISSSIADSLELQTEATGEISTHVTGALKRAGDVGRDMDQLFTAAGLIQGSTDILRGQSAMLDTQIGALSHEVEDFLRFLTAAA